MSISHSPPIRLLIVDDHEVVLEGLRALLGSIPGFSVIGAASDGDRGLQLHRVLRPDITLLDVRMNPMDGIQTLSAIKSSNPRARVIMLASDDFQIDVMRAAQYGAAGFMLKTATRSELAEAILQAHTFGWCHPFKPGQLSAHIQGENMLSGRELEVLDYVSRGLSNADIALALGITEHTIKAHLKTIFQKLDCADRTEAVVAAFKLGLIRVSPDQTTLAPNP